MAQITHEPAQNRLVIHARGFEEGQVCLNLPSRRWMAHKGVFIVPLTRMNAVALLKAGADGHLRAEGDGTIWVTLTAIANPPSLSRAFPEPFPFKVQPFPDQTRACKKAYRENNSALFMRPGSGKSFVLVNMFGQAHREGLIDIAVVICPLTVTTVWAGEDGQVAKYMPFPNWSVTTEVRHLETNRPMAKLQWLIVGVESLSQGGTFARLLAKLKGTRFALAVDESSRIKNHKAIRTERCIELGKLAVMRVIASGTPAVNSLIDLYSQFQFLDPNIIGVGDFYAFRSRYCRMGGYKMKQIVSYCHTEELLGLIEPYVFRCDKPAGLPKKLYTERVVQMSPEQKLMYNKVKSAEMPGISVKNILNKINKLQQVVGGFLLDDPVKIIDPATGREKKIPGKLIWTAKENPKIDALDEFIDEIGQGEQCIVWAKFLWEVDRTRDHVGKYGPVDIITGAVPVEERERIIRALQAGRIQYIVGNPQTGGIGITLTSAHYCYYYSNTYSLEDRIQSEDRLHRIGQENNVLYCDGRMERSVDTLIKNAIAAKMDLDEYIATQLDKAGEKAVLEML